MFHDHTARNGNRTAFRHTREARDPSLRFEMLEDRRMLTILLSEDLIVGDVVGEIAPSGMGTRENPYVYDFAGEDLYLGAFDIRRVGRSFRFENLGQDAEGNSIRYTGEGGDINVGHGLGDGGSVEILGAAGAIELSSIITAGNSGGRVAIDDGAMGPSGPIRVAGEVNTSSSDPMDENYKGSVLLHGRSVEVLGSIRTAGGDLAGGDITILGPQGVQVVGQAIVTSDGFTSGKIDIRGPGGVELSGDSGFSIDTRGRRGDVTMIVDTISLSGTVATSSRTSQAGNMRLEAASITLQGDVLAEGEFGGSVKIIGTEDLRIDAEMIATGGTAFGGDSPEWKHRYSKQFGYWVHPIGREKCRIAGRPVNFR